MSLFGQFPEEDFHQPITTNYKTTNYTFWHELPMYTGIMDKPVKKKKRTAPLLAAGIGLPAVALFVFVVLPAFTVKKAHSERSKLKLGTVQRKDFHEFISVEGSVVPKRTVTVTALQGGIVEEIFVEDGAEVKKGDPILRLSNPDFELDLMNREAQLLDQLNNLRNTEMNLENNFYRKKQELLGAENQHKLQKLTYETDERLHKKEAIPANEYKKSRDAYELSQANRSLLAESLQRDSLFRKQQGGKLRESTELIRRNLAKLEKTAEGLLLRAPADGRLTGFTSEIGQNVVKGTPLAGIDMPQGFKIRADIDEHYLSKVSEGLTAVCAINGRDHALRIHKVYPNVSNGEFRADLYFEGEPEGLRNGQTLYCRITLGAASPALVLPKGGFYFDTGGNWVFVLRGNRAEKRTIRTGRQNPDEIEILDGLSEGDQVIISGYADFGKADVVVVD